MEKLIFLILAVLILGFVLYLGGSAIMTGFKAKGENAPQKDQESQEGDENNNLDDKSNLSEELIKLNDLLKLGVLTKEEFDKAKKKILDD